MFYIIVKEALKAMNIHTVSVSSRLRFYVTAWMNARKTTMESTYIESALNEKEMHHAPEWFGDTFLLVNLL